MKSVTFCRVAISVTLVGTCLASSCAKAAEARNIRPTRSVVFKTLGEVQLRLHIFEPKDHRNTDRRAAIVFFFGGGWVGGSPAQFYPHADDLRRRGMLAISAEYRVKSRHKTSPFDCVRDGKSAIRWVRANANRLGVDPNRIVAAGGSAGGHVAACTGTIRGFDQQGEDPSVSSVPNAMVLFNPVIDTGPKGYGHQRLKDRFKEISPVDHIRPALAPTVIFHGTQDKTVPIENVRRFQARMKQAKNRCELLAFEGAGHGFFNFGRGGGNAYRKTMQATTEFLTSLGYLEKAAKKDGN